MWLTDVLDIILTRHGESSSALRPSRSREIRPTYGMNSASPWHSDVFYISITGCFIFIQHLRFVCAQIFPLSSLRSRMERFMPILTRKMAWSVSMTTLRNTITLRCSTKSTKRFVMMKQCFSSFNANVQENETMKPQLKHQRATCIKYLQPHFLSS